MQKSSKFLVFIIIGFAFVFLFLYTFLLSDSGNQKTLVWDYDIGKYTVNLKDRSFLLEQQILTTFPPETDFIAENISPLESIYSSTGSTYTQELNDSTLKIHLEEGDFVLSSYDINKKYLVDGPGFLFELNGIGKVFISLGSENVIMPLNTRINFTLNVSETTLVHPYIFPHQYIRFDPNMRFEKDITLIDGEGESSDKFSIQYLPDPLFSAGKILMESDIEKLGINIPFLDAALQYDVYRGEKYRRQFLLFSSSSYAVNSDVNIPANEKDTALLTDLKKIAIYKLSFIANLQAFMKMTIYNTSKVDETFSYAKSIKTVSQEEYDNLISIFTDYYSVMLLGAREQTFEAYKNYMLLSSYLNNASASASSFDIPLILERAYTKFDFQNSQSLYKDISLVFQDILTESFTGSVDEKMTQEEGKTGGQKYLADIHLFLEQILGTPTHGGNVDITIFSSLMGYYIKLYEALESTKDLQTTDLKRMLPILSILTTNLEFIEKIYFLPVRDNRGFLELHKNVKSDTGFLSEFKTNFSQIAGFFESQKELLDSALPGAQKMLDDYAQTMKLYEEYVYAIENYAEYSHANDGNQVLFSTIEETEMFKNTQLLGNKGEFASLKSVLSIPSRSLLVQNGTGGYDIFLSGAELKFPNMKDAKVVFKMNANYAFSEKNHYFYNIKFVAFNGNGEKLMGNNEIIFNGDIPLSEFLLFVTNGTHTFASAIDAYTIISQLIHVNIMYFEYDTVSKGITIKFDFNGNTTNISVSGKLVKAIMFGTRSILQNNIPVSALRQYLQLTLE